MAGAMEGERRLHPTVRLVWRLKALLAVVPLLLALVVAAVAGAPAAALVALVALSAVVAGIAWVVPGLVYGSWRYVLGERALELRHGLLTRHVSVVPWFRIQHVDIAQGAVERRIGLARLRVHTAAAGAVDALPGIRIEDAEALRLLVVARAEAGDGV